MVINWNKFYGINGDTLELYQGFIGSIYMKSVSSGKTRGSHPRHRSKKKKKIKKKKYVKFPKRFEKQKQTVSEQLQDELEPIISIPINSPMSDE